MATYRSSRALPSGETPAFRRNRFRFVGRRRRVNSRAEFAAYSQRQALRVVCRARN